MRFGECQASGGALVEGLASLEKAAELARRSRDKPTQKALVGKTAALRARIPLLTLDLPDDVKDPQVSIDGGPISAEKAAQPVAVNPGEHTVEVTAEGRTPFKNTLTLAEKERATLQVRLPRPGEPASEPAVEPAVEPRPSTPDADVSRPIPAATWIGGSAAVLLAAGGAVAFVVAGEMAADGEAACVAQVQCDPAAIDEVRRLDAAALGMWIGAGIGAGVAITFLVISQSGEPDRAAAVGSRPGAWSWSGARRPAPDARASDSRGAARLVLGPGSLRLSGSF